MIYVSLFFIILGLILLIVKSLKPKEIYPTKKKEKNKYCILIPARNESKVIENLLISIENQTLKIDSDDVYVIVEEKNDKTVDIAHNHGMNIVFRHDLTKKRKGYALDDAIKEILDAKKRYDAYFIFDADNVLDKNYMKEISKTIDSGYSIGVGYRNTKNGSSLVSAASALTFTMINTIGNKEKNNRKGITISGTGFYITGDLIEKWGGYPFNTLTEDYELTLYCILNNISTFYNDKAIFYDEQPESMKVSITQRSRWIKGYFEARSKYIFKIFESIIKKEKNYLAKLDEFIGVRPYIYIIIGVILLIISGYLKTNLLFGSLILCMILLIAYILLVIISIMILRSEKNKLDIKASKIGLVLYNPLFLATYIICALIALFKRNLGWTEIKHNKNI